MEVKHKTEPGHSFLNTSDGILLINHTDLKVIFLNSAAESLLELIPGEIVGRSLLTVVPEWSDLVGEKTNADESLISNRQKSSLITTKSGTGFFDAEFQRIPSKTEPPLGLIRFRKTNHNPDPQPAALGLSRETFELALDSANIGLIYIDVDAGTARWSKGQERLHGLEPGSFDGMLDTWKKFIVAEDLPRIESDIQAALQTNATIESEYRIRKASGQIRWLHVKFKTEEDEHTNTTLVAGINTDITPVKEKDQRISALLQRESAALVAFQQREETFRLLIEKSKDCISLTNGNGEIIYITPSVKTILGYSEEEMLDLRIKDRFHPEDKEKIGEIFKDFGDGKSVTHVTRVKHKDGFYRWVESTTTNFLNTPGINAVVSNFRDITERKKAEEIIIESEKQLRELADAMPQLVWMASPDGIVHYYNNRIHEYAGATQKEDRSWDWSPLLHPEDSEATTIAWQKAILTKTVYSIEHRVQMKDGGYRYHLSRAYPQFDRNGQINQWYGTATDIHEQKEAERLLKQYAIELEEKVNQRTEELRNQVAFAEAVIDSSLDVIAIYDRDTRLLNANRQFLERYKLSKENAIGKRLDELFPGSTEAQERIKKVFNGESLYYPAFKSNYSDNYYTSFLVPLKNSEGEIYAGLVVAHDVTEIIKGNEMIKVSADQLRAANESLVRKNHELEQFAYVASHDLQEPLRKISTFARMLEKNAEQIPEPSSKYVEKIIQSSNRMSQLISDVLQFSQLNKNEGFVMVDLNEVLNNIKTDLELLIDQKNALIESAHLPVIEAIPRQMGQLFYNLISNSLKFTSPDARAKVNITSQLISNPSSEGENQVRYKITFRDNGIGFNAAYAEKIFHMFQRLNTREQFSGSGIGLAMVKKIVSTHHGDIHAESEEGIGSQFHVILPAKQPS